MSNIVKFPERTKLAKRDEAMTALSELQGATNRALSSLTKQLASCLTAIQSLPPGPKKAEFEQHHAKLAFEISQIDQLGCGDDTPRPAA